MKAALSAQVNKSDRNDARGTAHTTRTNKWSWLKAWGTKIARRRGMKRAIVAVARRMAVITHRMWVDDTEFCWTREEVAAA